MKSCVEYIWLDGKKPTQKLRSKCRILDFGATNNITIKDFPYWSFDGSSTYQASGNKSDLVLMPVSFFKDPIRGLGNFLVLCEVVDDQYKPIESNTRAQLANLSKDCKKYDCYIGFEQEYTLFEFDKSRPLGWPKESLPKPQGDYYCGIGSNKMFGRNLVEAHMQACLKADLMIFGTNAEVMPSSWEFQIGYRNIDSEDASPINVSDQLWIARWLLVRIAENLNIHVSFNNKPMAGDWNGAGNHTNFSIIQMRNQIGGMDFINKFIETLKTRHPEHIKYYGHGLEKRLTGKYETCDINTFRAGPRDRGASIRIPDMVEREKCGYIEDRRPGANSDPYLVSYKLLETLLKID